MDLNLYKIDNTEIIEIKNELIKSGYTETPLNEKLEKSQYLTVYRKKNKQ